MLRSATHIFLFWSIMKEHVQALFGAVRAGDVAKVDRIVVEHGLVLADIRDEFNGTLLHHAAHTGQIAMFDHLVVKGLDPKKASNNGALPLHESAYSGYTEMFDHQVTKYGVDPATKDGHGRAAVRYAAYNNKTAMISHLATEHKLNPDELDNNGQTPIYYAATRGKIEAVDCLAAIIAEQDSSRTNPYDYCDQHGKTLLHHTAFHGQIPMFDHLVAKGLNPGKAANNGAIPMHEAAYNGQTQMVRHQITTYHLSADVRDNGGRTPLDYANENAKMETAQLIQSYLGKVKASEQVEPSTVMDTSTAKVTKINQKFLPCSDNMRGPIP